MKSKVFRPSSKKKSKRLTTALRNKWLVLGIIIFVALAGIVAIRVSQAAVGDITGRFPEDNSEPHIDYTYNPITQKAVLKKSTNGETRTVTGLDNAYAEGQKMYDEMIAAQQPKPAPSPSPSPTPRSTTPKPTNPTPFPGQTSPVPGDDTNNNSDATSGDSNSKESTTNGTDGSTKVVKKFLINLRRKVSIIPKIPSNIKEISSVRVLVDGKEVATSKASDYLIILDTTKISNGEHTLTTQLLNENGSVLYADSYPIKVDNSNSWIDRILLVFGY